MHAMLSSGLSVLLYITKQTCWHISTLLTSWQRCLIRFQIRHGSVDRLLDRLTDLRFLSIDFLNTFLLTYRVFTTGPRVLEALKKVYRSPDGASGESDADILSEQ